MSASQPISSDNNNNINDDSFVVDDNTNFHDHHDYKTTTSTMTTTSSPPSVLSSSASSSSPFVDYTPPPEIKLLPPAKYKLWWIVFILVYFAAWVSDDAQFLYFLRFNGWLSPEAALFVMLGIIVFVLVYGTMDLVIVGLTFSIKKKQENGEDTVVHYGVGPWLKRPRAEWMYRLAENDHTGNDENDAENGNDTKKSGTNPVLLFFVDVMAGIVHVLEDGFAMFDAPPSLSEQVVMTMQRSPSSSSALQFECANGDHNCERTLKIEHRIRPDKLEDYNKWKIKIHGAVGHADGLVANTKTELQTRDCPGAETDIEAGLGGAGVEEQQPGGPSTIKEENVNTDSNADNNFGTSSHSIGVSTSKRQHLYQAIFLKFANIDYLNDWMLSPRRKALMKELEPMLVVPDTVQIQAMRQLPDAFSDLLTRQGNAVPKSPPKKWKVWWLTLVALYITIRWTNGFLPYYYDQWGLTEADDARLERLVNVFVATFLNSYVMAPLFLFLFDHWLQNDPPIKNSSSTTGRSTSTKRESGAGASPSSKAVSRQPWRALEDGFQSIWPKILLTVAFYGGCLVTLLLKREE